MDVRVKTPRRGLRNRVHQSRKRKRKKKEPSWELRQRIPTCFWVPKSSHPAPIILGEPKTRRLKELTRFACLAHLPVPPPWEFDGSSLDEVLQRYMAIHERGAWVPLSIIRVPLTPHLRYA